MDSAAQFLDPVNYHFSAYAVPPFIVGLASVIIGHVFLFRERGSFISFWFFVTTLNASLWLLCYSGLYSTVNPQAALVWALLANSAVAFIPTSVYGFTLAVVERFRQYRMTVLASFLASCFAVLCIAKTDWMLKGVKHYFWGYYSQYEGWSALFLCFFFLMMFVSLSFYADQLRKSHSTTRKKRLKLLLIAFSLGYVASVDYFAAFDIPLYPFGYIPVFGFLMIVTRAIWRYRLHDITPSFAGEQIIRTMADVLLVVDAEGVIRVDNEAAREIFSTEGRALSGSHVNALELDFFSKDRLSRMICTGKVQQSEIVFHHPSRGEIILDVSTSVIRDEGARGVAIVFIAKDNTVRRKADMALIESEKHYRLLAENATDVIWTVDMGLNYTYVSPSVKKLRGFTAQEAMSQNMEKSLTPQSFKAFASAVNEDLAKENEGPAGVHAARTLELEYCCKDGTTVWTEVRISFMRIKEGKPFEILGVTRDITERKRADQALRESERCYAELIQQAPDPIVTLDRLGYLKTVNPAAELALGYSSQELMGKHFAKLGVLSEESIPKALQEFTMTILGWQRPPFELRMMRKDQAVIYMEANPRLIRTDRENSRVQVIFRDITERKRFEASRPQAA